MINCAGQIDHNFSPTGYKMLDKNELLKNLGKADITSQVNFSLLKEFFLKNKCKVKKVITQKEFLIKMGINTRAEIIAKKMKFVLFY